MAWREWFAFGRPGMLTTLAETTRGINVRLQAVEKKIEMIDQPYYSRQLMMLSTRLDVLERKLTRLDVLERKLRGANERTD